MFNFFKKKTKSQNIQKQVAHCPKCNAKIIEDDEYWSCQNVLSKTCDFRIKNTLNGEKIDIKYLINFEAMEGLTDIYNEIESKSKEQLAAIKYFSSNNVKKFKGYCDRCHSPLYRVDNFIKCKGENCNFSINSTYKGITFSDSEMNKLFGRIVSNEYDFLEPNGSKVRGRVLILQDENYKVLPEYVFFSDPNELDEKYLNLYYLSRAGVRSTYLRQHPKVKK